MKEAPVKSLAPITFRITADVKPKPIVAEIKVGSMNNDYVMEIIYVPHPPLRYRHQVSQCQHWLPPHLRWKGSLASHSLLSR